MTLSWGLSVNQRAVGNVRRTGAFRPPLLKAERSLAMSGTPHRRLGVEGTESGGDFTPSGLRQADELGYLAQRSE